ncbi:hypothetical protein [Devosia sp.]|uniref:hypothetical protein n=1 Tax=Devosia sp. TaxID=1871048 RepID=UPI003A8D56FE
MLLSLGLVSALALSACTTTEGTNAFTDIGTFEREVATETLRGLGMIEREEKDEDVTPRGPLVMPKTASLPAPRERTAAAQLPEDSDTVRIEGVSEADLRRLRNARVLDGRTQSGRPLTAEETRRMTARMQGAAVQRAERPLYLPPEDYYTTVKGQDLVCLAANGELVPLTDPSCPPEIRKSLGG